MWILSRLGTDEKIIILPGKEKFSVGRSGTDLVLKDDLSVSRAHAVFHITSGANNKIELEDCGSRYGTFHNDGIKLKKPMEKLIRIPLQDGDRILFGAISNIWHLSDFQIRTLASALARTQIQKLEIALLTLGGKVEESWRSCCTHLTMEEVSVTVKLLHALLEQMPVVSSNYWFELMKFANRGLFNGTLPSPENFPPKNLEEMNIGVRPERKSLFTGKTFVFMNRKHIEMYGPIVKKAGAACKDLNSGVKTAFLIKDNVIVVQFVPSSQSQATETITSISGILEEKSLRLIPEYEIGLAIVYCSIKKYCNPKYKLIKDILPSENGSELQLPVGTMFVENTAEEESVQTGARTEVVVPESEAVNKKKPNLPIDVIEINDEEDENNCMPGISVAERNANDSNHIKRKRQKQLQQIHFQSDEDDDLPRCKRGRNQNVFESDDDNEEDMPIVQLRKNQRLNVEPKSRQSPRRSTRNNPTTPEPDKTTSKARTSLGKEAELTTKKVTPPAAKKSPKKTLPVEKPKNIPFFGFLEKSQTPALQNNRKESRQSSDNSENNAITRKRMHISVITESDDDDDLFDFGDPNESQTIKKPRMSNNANNDDLDGELFNFDGKSTEPQNAENGDEDDITETEPLEPINSTKGKSFVMPKPKPTPRKVNISEWLSCSIKLEDDKNMVKKEATVLKKEELNDNDNSNLDPVHVEWLNSIKNSIVVGMIDLNIKTMHAPLDQIDTSVGSISTISGCKNFKAFVKTCQSQQKPRAIKLIPSTLGINL